MPKAAVIMGSRSDYDSMKDAIDTLESFGITVEKRIVSAHRTPEFMAEFARQAHKNGIEVIIAGAGGSAHLPGMTASYTHLPVIGVPIQSKALNGIDSLLSIVQMPPGIPVATVGIGNSKNAALLAVRVLSIKYHELAEKMQLYMKEQETRVLQDRL